MEEFRIITGLHCMLDLVSVRSQGVKSSRCRVPWFSGCRVLGSEFWVPGSVFRGSVGAGICDTLGLMSGHR